MTDNTVLKQVDSSAPAMAKTTALCLSMQPLHCEFVLVLLSRRWADAGLLSLRVHFTWFSGKDPVYSPDSSAGKPEL